MVIAIAQSVSFILMTDSLYSLSFGDEMYHACRGILYHCADFNCMCLQCVSISKSLHVQGTIVIHPAGRRAVHGVRTQYIYKHTITFPAIAIVYI